MNGRRLDLDYKRRRGGKVPAEEVEQAWEKFLTSKELAESSMFVLLQNDVGIRRRNPLSSLKRRLVDVMDLFFCTTSKALPRLKDVLEFVFFLL